jgi:adenylate kinase family enzyme
MTKSISTHPAAKEIKRILVTGNKGSGKTRLAEWLSRDLELPLHRLEALFWQPGWKLAPLRDRSAILTELAGRESWLVVGQATALETAADLVIVVHSPRWKCLLAYLWQALPWMFRSRPTMPAHCPEILGLFVNLSLVWRFPGAVVCGMVECCTEIAPESDKEEARERRRIGSLLAGYRCDLSQLQTFFTPLNCVKFYRAR